MKQRILIPVCALLLVFWSTGCEKIIDFKGEVTDPLLTLSAQAEAGEPLEVYVASSIFFLSDQKGGSAFYENLDQERGQVRCFVNGASTAILLKPEPEELQTSLHYVASDYAPAPGDHIRIEAEFPGFDPVWGETDVPLMPSFEVISVKWRKMTAADEAWIGEVEDDVMEAEITLALTDDASYDKYYFLQPFAELHYDYMDEIILVGEEFTSNDVLFQGIGGESALSNFMGTDNFFADDLIKGQRHEFTIKVSYLSYMPTEMPRLWLHVAAVNESLYWYGKSYDSLAGEFAGLFSEGVTLYSNVHGGYGVVCAAASLWLDVER